MPRARALIVGHELTKKVPRGYGKLSDQLVRALLGTYLQLTEAAAREGADRRQRFRCARAECNEAAAAIEAVQALGFASETESHEALVLLDRLAGMLTRLGGLSS